MSLYNIRYIKFFQKNYATMSMMLW